MFSLLGYLLSEDPVQLGVQGLYIVLQQLHFIMAIGNDTVDFFLDFPQALVVSGQFFLGTVRLVAKLLLTSQVTGHSKSVAAVLVAPAEGFVDKTSGIDTEDDFGSLIGTTLAPAFSNNILPLFRTFRKLNFIIQLTFYLLTKFSNLFLYRFQRSIFHSLRNIQSNLLWEQDSQKCLILL